ncbi:MAG: hypothetical protein D6702_05820 [Planctomycetota bacterium]|nr:MAG: hypothetical protein D6702_05820 [Planctomycetota bacterium]
MFGALYRRRLVVLAVLAGALGSAAWFVASVPPLHQAAATLFVRTDLPHLSLESVAPALPRGAVLPDPTEAARVGVLGVASSNAAFQRALERLPDFDLARLRERVILDIDPSQQLLVLATDPDPAVAVRVANEFARAVADLLSEMAERQPRLTLATLQAELPRAREEYLAAQDALLTWLTEIGSPDPEQDLALLIQERQALRDAIADLDLAEERSRVEIPLLERRLAERPELVLARKTVSESPAYRQALADVAAARTELAVARVRYRSEHPRVRELEARLAAAEERVREEGDRGIEQAASSFEPDPVARALLDRLVQAEVEAAGVAPAREDLLDRLQANAAALAGMPLNRAELARLEHDIEEARTHLERVRARVEELSLELEQGIRPVYLDEDNLAAEDRLIELPSETGVFAFAALTGLLGGLLLAVVVELIAQARGRAPF